MAIVLGVWGIDIAFIVQGKWFLSLLFTDDLKFRENVALNKVLYGWAINFNPLGPWTYLSADPSWMVTWAKSLRGAQPSKQHT
jgi:hypothetical protein